MSKREAEETIGEASKKVSNGSENGGAVHHIDHAAKAHDSHHEHKKPTLYHMQHCCSTRPFVLIHELGIADKIDTKVLQWGEAKSEEMLALNPHGTVPTLKDEHGHGMLESGGITMHLLEKYGGKDHALWGKPEHRAELWQWLFYAPSTLYRQMGDGFGKDEEKKAAAKAQLEKVHLPFLAARLGDKHYFLGDDFTVADIFLGYELAGLHYLKWLDSQPKLKAYVERLYTRPSFQAAFPSVVAEPTAAS